MAKEYYNRKLNLILSAYINFGTYGIAAPILKDIFQRRAYEFGFSNKQMIEEIRAFSRNCKNVNFLTARNCSKENPDGYYAISKKNIYINTDSRLFTILRKVDKEKNGNMANLELYSTIAHEVLHAILKRTDITTGVMYIDENGKEQGIALNEIITEQAANRISFHLNSKKSIATNGYSTITPMVNLLAAACGIPEKDLLKAGTQTREELISVLLQKFPVKEHEQVKDRLKKFEINLDMIYNIHYGKEKNELSEQILSNLYGQIEEITYTLASSQMSYNENLTPMEKAIRLRRIEQIEDSIKGNFIKFDTTEEATRKKEEILSMPGVKDASENIGELFDREYTSDNKWDNPAIYRYIGFIFEIQKLKNKQQQIRDTIRTFISGGRKLLTSGKKNEEINENSKTMQQVSNKGNIYEETPFDKRYKVKDENLTPMKDINGQITGKEKLRQSEDKGFSK